MVEDEGLWGRVLSLELAFDRISGNPVESSWYKDSFTPPSLITQGVANVKKYGFLLLAILLMSSTGGYAQDDTALIDAAINAFNTQDAAYFEKALAPEAVWLDEDGHAIAGKERVTSFIARQVMGQKITTRKVKVYTSGDAAWSHFNSVIEGEGHEPIQGLGSAVFKKVGSDWQIVMIHGAHNVGMH